MIKDRYKTLAKTAVSLILLAIIFTRFHPRELWQALATADLRFILSAGLLALPILFLKSLKWLILSQQVDNNLTWREATLSLLAGMGVGLATPSRVGEITRVSYLPTNKKANLVGLVIMDRLVDLLVVLLTGAIALGLAFNRFGIALSLLLPTFMGLIMLFIPGLPGKLVAKLTHLSFLPGRQQIEKIGQGLELLDYHTLLLILMLALLTFGLALYQFFWLLLSFGVKSWLATAVSFPILTLAGVLPITISGFGTREGAAVLLLSLYHIPEATALNATLLSFIFNSFIPGLAGLIIAPTIPTTSTAAKT